MKSYKELEEEFDNEVAAVQEKCPHEETEWMEQWWAVGHSTGYKVKMCKFCNKIVEKVKNE